MPKMLQWKRITVSALFFLLVVSSSSPQERWQPVYLPNGKVLVEAACGCFCLRPECVSHQLSHQSGWPLCRVLEQRLRAFDFGVPKIYCCP